MGSKLQQTSPSTGLLVSVMEPIVPNGKNMKSINILSLYGDTYYPHSRHKDSFSERLTKVCLIYSQLLYWFNYNIILFLLYYHTVSIILLDYFYYINIRLSYCYTILIILLCYFYYIFIQFLLYYYTVSIILSYCFYFIIILLLFYYYTIAIILLYYFYHMIIPFLLYYYTISIVSLYYHFLIIFTCFSVMGSDFLSLKLHTL